MTASLLASSSNAEEPMQRFVDALRDRGYFDVAIDYLEKVDVDSLSAGSKEKLPLEKATIYSQAAASSRDLRQADSYLKAAQKAIANYRPKKPSAIDKVDAARFRGDLLFNRARVNLARTSVGQVSDSQRNEINRQARTLFASSLESYQAATKNMVSVLKNFKIDPNDGASASKLARLRDQYTFLKTRVPTINESIAKTLKDKSKEQKKLLKQTADEAKSVWKQYKKYAPSLQACLTGARCFQKLGNLDASQEMVNEIFALSRSEVPASILREAFSIAAANWQATAPFPWEVVVKESAPFVEALTPQQSSHPQWQVAQLAYARALHAKSKSVSGKAKPNEKRKAAEAAELATKLAQSIANSTGDQREPAIQLLKSWNASYTAPSLEDTDELATATTFADAEQRGKAIVQEIQPLLRTLTITKAKARQARTASDKQKTQSELFELNQQIATRSKSALKLFNQAILLADATVTRPQIISIRNLQCYCYFAQQKYLESSVIADFLMEKYPNATGTRQSAAILIRTKAAILDAAEGDKEFEKQQLIQACQLILERFPDTNESSSAAARLARLAMADGDFAQAKTWFAKLPRGDAQRTPLALSMGRKAWFDWSKEKPGNLKTQNEQLRVAIDYLAEGVDNSSAENLSYAAAEGSLLLTQALLANGKVDAAITQLESAKIAPLKLVAPTHPTLKSVGLVNAYHQQVVLTAINAYTAAMSASPGSQQQWIDKADRVISGLRNRLEKSGKPEDIKRLSGIYQLISQRLIEQFNNIEAGPARAKFGTSLSSFLTSIEEQSQNAQTVVWAGSTLLSVADSLRQEGSTDQAEPIYAKAVSALDRAEKLGFGEGKSADAMTRELKRQRALAQRGSGKFDAALQQFTQLLTAKAGDLTTQLDAAMTLQQKATASNDAQDFARAILGTSPVADPKTKRKQNAIWGWRKLVLATRGRNQFQSAFYQSLYYMIEARYQMGRIEQSAEGIQKALTEIETWNKRNPNFDNGPWKQKFDSLKQRIQNK